MGESLKMSGLKIVSNNSYILGLYKSTLSPIFKVSMLDYTVVIDNLLDGRNESFIFDEAIKVIDAWGKMHKINIIKSYELL